MKPKALLLNISDIGDIVSSMVILDPLLQKGYEVFFHAPGFCQGLFSGDGRVQYLDLVSAQKMHFDLLIDLTSARESRPLVKSIKSKVKLGRIKTPWKKLRYFLTYNRFVAKNPTGHIVGDYAFITESLGLPTKDRPRLHVLKTDILERLGFKQSDKLVSIHFGAHNPKRVIPENLISAAINFLNERGFKIFLIGTEDEIAQEILRKNNHIPMYKKLNLSEVKEVLAFSKLFIGADSGILHMAAALNVPSIGVYGPNTPQRSGPLGEHVKIFEQNLDCRPCNQNIPCPIDVKCMKTLSPNTLLEMMEAMLSE